jgi:lipid-A-disaccharide synthase
MTRATGPRILLSAGEPSGDLHGAKVASALFARFPNCRIDAVGGPHLEAAGATIVCSIDRLSTLGLLETVWHLPAHIALYRRLKRALAAGSYDLVIPVDYPGFNLRLSQAAKAAGVPVLFYIAPQLWAWRPGRAKRFAAAVDRMAVILPFEEDFFNKVGLASTFVGHPLLDGDAWPDRSHAREELGVPQEDSVLAVFPGSRKGEVLAHWETFRGAAARLHAEGRCRHILVAATPRGDYPDPGPCHIIRDRPISVLAAADAAIAKSGTTTLQAAVAGTPMVVAYRASPITVFIVRRLVTVSAMSLVNLIAGRPVVPELLQKDATEERLAEAVRPLLTPGSAEREAQLEGLGEVRRRLGQPGAADRLAGLAADLLQDH